MPWLLSLLPAHAAGTDEVETRYLLIWMLQRSIQTGHGIAHDHGFATHPPYVKDAVSECRAAFESLLGFVKSRCKDLMVILPNLKHSVPTIPYGIEYQHRVVYDFLQSPRMRSEVDSHVPKHFRAPEFPLKLGLADFQFKVDLVEADSELQSVLRPELYAHRIGLLISKLADCLDRYLTVTSWHAGGTINKHTVKACQTSSRQSLQRLMSRSIQPRRLSGDWYLWAKLMLTFARTRHFDFIEDVVHFVSKSESEFIQLADIESRTPIDAEAWSYTDRWYIRRPVPGGESISRDKTKTPSRTTCYYLPCESASWIDFLIHVREFDDVLDSEPLQNETRTREKSALSHAISLFLEAGASTEVEICDGEGSCHGPVCVCPDPSTHSGLYECPEPDPETRHTHDWASVKNVVLEILGISESELIQKFPNSQSCGNLYTTELLAMAVRTDSVWRQYVQRCVFDDRRPLGQ